MTMNKKRSSKQNLKFFNNRHEEAGCDFDYLDKLSPEEAQWLETFTRGYYTGDKQAIKEQATSASPPEDEQVKESNRRRYMNTPDSNGKMGAEALLKRSGLNVDLEFLQEDDLDPEQMLLIKESLEK
jgi:hypothetical protein